MFEIEDNVVGEISEEKVRHIDVIEGLRSEAQLQADEAVRYAMKYAETQRDTILRQTKSLAIEIIRGVKEEIRSRNERILKVSVDAVTRELSLPASPYLPKLLINAKLNLNSLLVGPAGCGKTIVARQVSEALDLPFGQLCLTAGASESWLFGRQTPAGFITGTFSEMYEHGGVFLADEMDAADPNLLLAINTALANGQLYNPISGRHIMKHPNFIFIGAANTHGKGSDFVYTGRSRLDGATLDRFVIINCTYSDQIEKMVCPDVKIRTFMQGVRAKLAEMKSAEIFSTRALEKAFLLTKAGVPMKEIFQSLTSGWNQDLVVQCGMGKYAGSIDVFSKPTPKQDPGYTAGLSLVCQRCSHDYNHHYSNGSKAKCNNTGCKCDYWAVKSTANTKFEYITEIPEIVNA